MSNQDDLNPTIQTENVLCEQLKQLGLLISEHWTNRGDWGFEWVDASLDWEGPYESRTEAIGAAFDRAKEAINALHDAPFATSGGVLVRWTGEQWESAKYEQGKLWRFTGNLAQNQGWEGVESEETTMTETTVSTLVPSTNRGRYACDDPQYGHNLTSGEPITLLLGGHEIKGHIEHSDTYDRPGCYQVADWGKEGKSRKLADPLAASLQTPHDLSCGYSFIAEDGTVCGLCTGMEVRLSPMELCV